MSDEEVRPGAEAFRELYDGAYDAWKAYMDDEPTTALRRALEERARALEVEKLPDATWTHGQAPDLIRECAAELRDAILAPSHPRGDWGYSYILALVRIGPVLIAHETPGALCRNCKMRADEGGGPSCECDK